MKWVYLCGAIIGTALPLTFLARFLNANGLDASAFAHQLFKNNIAMFFAMDVVVSAFVLWAFIFAEGRKQRMGHLWAYVLCTLLVGVSLALPLFLFFRERKLFTSGHQRL
jgi:Terpene cyclase DEP1